MILESCLLDVLPGCEKAFVAAFDEACPLIAAQHGFRTLELRRCLDEGRGSRFLLQVAWDRMEDHTEGFRRSAEYARWHELLHPFYSPAPQVEHYGVPLVSV
jgi:heme-degrading monooxygenase HmoA